MKYSYIAQKASARRQARRLKDKLTPEQLTDRANRIHARKTVAEKIVGSQNILLSILNAHTSVLKRGILGRLKWLVFGK